MRKIITLLIALLITSICIGQTVDHYKIVVYYSHGTDTINVNNTRLNTIPAPIVKDGSIFYDEEYLLTDVDHIKIFKTYYSKLSSRPKKSKYAIKQYTYWNYKYGRYVTVNVIYDPRAEEIQRRANSGQR